MPAYHEPKRTQRETVKKMDAVDKAKSESDLVETLFGPMPDSAANGSDAEPTEEEADHYLYNAGNDGEQKRLPLINVPLGRPKTVEVGRVADLVPYLDELALFEKRWGFEKEVAELRENWCLRMRGQAVPVLNRLVELCDGYDVLQPRAVYAYFHAASRDGALLLYGRDKTEPFLSVNFKRGANGVCAADKIARADSGEFDTVAAVGVNMGRNAAELAKSWLEAGKETDFRYLHGFALEMLNAMTDYAAARIGTEECCLGDVFGLGTAKQGDPRVQSPLIKALDASSIDIAFSRNYLMMPEYSSLALVFPR